VDVRGAGYKDIIRENGKFEEFYAKQDVCKDENELKEMMEAFKKDLPASFRVTGFRSQVGNFLIRSIAGN